MNDALPNDATGYVFAAYAFVFLLLLIYIWILGAKFQRLSREIARLNEDLESGTGEQPDEARAETAGA